MNQQLTPHQQAAFDLVCEVFDKFLGVEKTKISLTSSTTRDLNFDSLSDVEAGMALEDSLPAKVDPVTGNAFKVQIEDSITSSLKTVQEWVNCLVERTDYDSVTGSLKPKAIDGNLVPVKAQAPTPQPAKPRNDQEYLASLATNNFTLAQVQTAVVSAIAFDTGFSLDTSQDLVKQLKELPGHNTARGQRIAVVFNCFMKVIKEQPTDSFVATLMKQSALEITAAIGQGLLRQGRLM